MLRSIKRISAKLTGRTIHISVRQFHLSRRRNLSKFLNSRSSSISTLTKSKSSRVSTVSSTVPTLSTISKISRRHLSSGGNDSVHSNIGQESGGGYLQTGHRRDGLFDPTLPPRILVTGASGQIGSELVPYLRNKYGADTVIASDVQMAQLSDLGDGPFVYADVTDYNQLARVVLEYRIDWVFHLAALLSAVGERQPQLALSINNKGVENVLELSKLNQLRCFIPSSIAAFGPSTPKRDTPNVAVMRPTTVYGITKVYSELLGEYYHQRYDVDFRSLRYPGIVSNKTLPGGGTTDYAVEIYHEALERKKYKCFLSKSARLPMMYMPDALRATVELMEADELVLNHRVYNVSGMTFNPKEQAESIVKYIPEFEMKYKPDFRENIARSWPKTIDDTMAARDWGWKAEYSLDDMTKDMLEQLKIRYEKQAAKYKRHKEKKQEVEKEEKMGRGGPINVE